MAKKFAGFTPEQMGKIIPEMQGMQADEQAAYLASQPAAAARVGKMAEAAQKRIGMAYGGMVKSKGYAEGGVAPTTFEPDLGRITANIDQMPNEFSSINPTDNTSPGFSIGVQSSSMAALDASKQKFAEAQAALTKAQQALAASPEDSALAEAVGKAQAAVATASSEMANATSAYSAVEGKSAKELQAKATGSDPSQLVTKGTVATVSDADKAAGTIAAGTGAAGAAPTATQTTATAATPAAAPIVTPAATTTAATAEAGVQDVMDKTTAAEGAVSEGAQVTAAEGDPTKLAQLDLKAAQGEAAKVEGAPTRTLDQAELISGSSVDQKEVQQIYGTQPLEAASVATELDTLMADFEGGATPAWASGAMRNATAKMAARGLSSSSMAGMAIVQAAMESALPIAQMDASNKQAIAIESARQRSSFLQMEFTQEFQSKVQNAARISEIANMNFTAEQQVALENAKMAQTMNLANLSNRQAKVMADAAAMSQMDLTNLNNRQQAQVQNAKAFLQMDMANLSNKQQTAIFKAQQMTNTLLSDTAAENASRQFNASSQNQTDQFFANLASQVERFNTEQSNQINRFNAGEANAITQFNATQQAAREQFNSTNQLVIAQANAQWFQATTTAETAAQNQMNRDAAAQANKMTETAYNAAVQMERDAISYAFRAAESAMEREIELTLQGMRNEMDEAKIQAEIDKARGSGWGAIANTVAEAAAKWAFS